MIDKPGWHIPNEPLTITMYRVRLPWEDSDHSVILYFVRRGATADVESGFDAQIRESIRQDMKSLTSAACSQRPILDLSTSDPGSISAIADSVDAFQQLPHRTIIDLTTGLTETLGADVPVATLAATLAGSMTLPFDETLTKFSAKLRIGGMVIGIATGNPALLNACIGSFLNGQIIKSVTDPAQPKSRFYQAVSDVLCGRNLATGELLTAESYLSSTDEPEIPSDPTDPVDPSSYFLP